VTHSPFPPGTSQVSQPASVLLERDDGTDVGHVSSVQQTFQLPQDCGPPPPAGEDCLATTLRMELALGGCAPESVSLVGSLRWMRDAPADPAATGRERIEALAAWGRLEGSAACAGPLTLRVAPAVPSSGEIASFDPLEFFPAETYLDLFVEIDRPAGTVHGGPLHLATTVDSWPPPVGETLFGPPGALQLLDGGGSAAGEVSEVTAELGTPVACGDLPRSHVALGPGKSSVAVGIPGGGAGVGYDVVRGDLGFLLLGGSFITSVCVQTDGPEAFVDREAPDAGEGFYYVAREGFGAFNGTWNEPGTAQQNDRDPLINTPPCP
jgi:hypothetical protein